MIAYHGSNMEINNIDLLKCRRYKDFGQGFYTTTLEQQAIDMAKRVVRRFQGTPTVTKFEFDDSKIKELNIKKFDGVSEEWALMVVNNRNENLSKLTNELNNQDNKYDIVIQSNSE